MSLYCAAQRASRPVAWGLVIAFAAACNADRADVLSQSGDFILNFVVDGSLAGGLPSGSETIVGFTVAAVDTTVSDAFARSTTELPSILPGCFGDGFGCFFFDFEGALRTADMAITDTRFMTDPTAITFDPAEYAFGVLADPATAIAFDGGADEGDYNLWVPSLPGLQPGTNYTVGLWRPAVTIQVELDHAARVLGEVPTPDAIANQGGAPAGCPLLEAGFPWAQKCLLTADANPFIVGFATADINGLAEFDLLIDSNGFWADSTVTSTTHSPFGPNTQSAYVTTIPQYGYVVVWEGQGTAMDPVPPGPIVAVWQISNDLDASGQPINNALAPYPAGAFTDAELLAGPGVAGKASDVRVTASNLAGLSGSLYQVWLLNEETGSMISPTGDWVATEGVDTVASGSGVRSFTSERTWTHEFRTSDVLAGEPIGDFTHVFLSVETTEAATPSAIQPVWARYTEMNGEPDDPFAWAFNATANLTFGTFGSGDPTPWSPSGLGQGGFWGEELGTTDRLVVDLRNLPIPPRGYYYEGWLLNEAGMEVHAGDLTTPFDEGFASLRDVDEDQSISEHVRSDLILQAVTRVFAEDLGAGVEFPSFDEYRLVLSPKARTAVRPPTTTVGGLTPDALRDRRP